MNGAYDVRTKEFYSLLYMFVPVYFFIGLIAAFFISPYRYRVLVVGVGKVKIVAMLVSYLLLSLLPMVAPMVGFGAPTWLALFNTIMVAGIVYMSARILVAVVVKFRSRA